MQATRFRVAALLALFALAGSPGCGDDEPSSTSGCPDCGGEGGGGDSAGVAGDTAGASGSATVPQGGAEPGTSSAGATSRAGADGGGGQGGAGNGGVAGGEAGSTGETSGEQLELCTRLAHGSQDADAVASAYVGAVYRDCRVSWVVPRGQALADLVNQLVSFSYNLWGCERTLPVDQFGLVLGTPALSRGDVSVLIDQYLTAAQKTLDLSPEERETMQAALLRLAKPLNPSASEEPSRSACSENTGGAGGVSSGGAAAGGAATGGADVGGANAGGAGGTP